MRTSKTRAVAGAVAIALCAFQGCAHLGAKTVAAKNPPTQLIAQDGSHCNVSEERWEKVIVGMKVMCSWQGGSVRNAVQK